MRALVIVLPLILAAGCATSATDETRLHVQQQEAARLDAALAGFTPGTPVTCLPSQDVRGPEAYGENVLLFRVGQNLIFRSTTHGSCRGVGRGETLITRHYTGRMCSGDIARTANLTTGIETGSCVLGDFVPYRRR